MKRILVIGGTRFVGKELVKRLLDEGCDVTVANRTGKGDFFGGGLNYIKIDRNNKEVLRKKLTSEKFDMVYDMICYSPKNAIDICETISTEKYIMISSSVVYGWGKNHLETNFDANKSIVVSGTIEELQKIYGFKQAYMLGKMGAEYIVNAHTGLNTIIVRFPIVIGEQDHTRRVESYVDAIKRGECIYVDNLTSEVSMVEKNNAAEYLSKFLHIDCQGSINLSDTGKISFYDFIKKIGDCLDKEIKYSAEGIAGGYNGFYNNTLNLEKMDSIGIRSHDINESLTRYLEKFKRGYY